MDSRILIIMIKFNIYGCKYTRKVTTLLQTSVLNAVNKINGLNLLWSTLFRLMKYLGKQAHILRVWGVYYDGSKTVIIKQTFPYKELRYFIFDFHFLMRNSSLQLKALLRNSLHFVRPTNTQIGQELKKRIYFNTFLGL